MADAGNILIVIPARGGSKRLPRKNVLPLAGKPLICWTIEAAIVAELGARIVVTSDDDETLSLARGYEAQGVISHRRPDELATDAATTTSAIIDVVAAEQNSGYTPQTVIVLQPTSPLRIGRDIVAALGLFEKTGCSDTVVTVCEVDHPSAWVGTIGEDNELVGIDLVSKSCHEYEKEYRLNGAVYVASVSLLKLNNTLLTAQLKASVMPRVRSVDIDEEVDFRYSEALLKDGCNG